MDFFYKNLNNPPKSNFRTSNSINIEPSASPKPEVDGGKPDKKINYSRKEGGTVSTCLDSHDVLVLEEVLTVNGPANDT